MWVLFRRVSDIRLNRTYPYRSFWGANYQCVFNNTKKGPNGTPVVATVDGYYAVTPNNYSAAMSALSNVGPLSIAVDAGAWPSYHSGVYDGCHGNLTLDHAVQLVGYGTDEETNMPYWLVRNSWGTDYGELGCVWLLHVCACVCVCV